MADTAGPRGHPYCENHQEIEEGAVKSKTITAAIAAGAIAAVLTLLSATNARLDPGTLAKPAETAFKTCTRQPWPYLNCAGTSLGNPRIRPVTTERLTP
jgi:hypothetical protein